MINHYRTLILNKAATSRPPKIATLGEELVDPDFRPVTNSKNLQQIRDIILGTDPDPVFENFRLAQIAQILTNSEFYKEYILRLDSRITFDVNKNTDFFDLESMYSVDTQSDSTIRILSKLEPDIGLGRSVYEWFISAGTGNIITVEDLNYPGSVSTVVSFADGISSDIAVPNSNYALRLQGSVMPSNGTIWSVSGIADLSEASFVDVFDKIAASELVEGLFGINKSGNSFYNLYSTNRKMNKIIGFLLAFIWELQDEYLEAQK